MIAWLEAGTSLVHRFPGFLGSGWLRPEPGSDTWHMLFRFADAESLDAWEQSSERRWWRASAATLGLEESRFERLTGIEGWFDEPASREVDGVPAAAPPRWKQASVIFLVFYPLSVLANLLAKHTVATWYLPLRVLATVLVMTPIMTYLALPWITRRMDWFLHGRPAPWRHRSGAGAGRLG